MLYDVKERFKLAGLCVPYPKEWNLSTLEEKSMVKRLLDDGYCDVDEREVVSLNSLGNELLHDYQKTKRMRGSPGCLFLIAKI